MHISICMITRGKMCTTGSRNRLRVGKYLHCMDRTHTHTYIVENSWYIHVRVLKRDFSTSKSHERASKCAALVQWLNLSVTRNLSQPSQFAQSCHHSQFAQSCHQLVKVPSRCFRLQGWAYFTYVLT
jgi:hypothetical protein